MQMQSVLWPLLLIALCVTVVHAHPRNETDKCGLFSRHTLRADTGALCLDGTPASYFYQKGFGSGIDKWMVFFQGGGWCYDLRMCHERSKHHFGSSVREVEAACARAENVGGYLSGYKHASNRVTFNFHYVHVNYCDGGSFAGDAEAEYEGSTLHFKGAKIRRAVIDDLMTRLGMGNATDVVVTGSSAGGLAIYLGIDEIRAQIHSYRKDIDVGGLADAGYFPDYVSTVPPRPVDPSTWTSSSGIKLFGEPPQYFVEEYDERENITNYPKKIRHLFRLMNISAGAPVKCIAQHRGSLSNCMFAENLLPTVESPLLIMQSKFDTWHTKHILGMQTGDSSSNEYINNTNAIGRNITARLLNIARKKNNVVVFLDSCRHHSFNIGQYLTLIRDDTDVSPADVFDGWIERFFTAHQGKVSRHQVKFQLRDDLSYHQAHDYPCTHCCHGHHVQLLQ